MDNTVFVGRKPLYVYKTVAMEILQRGAAARILGRGILASKAISVTRQLMLQYEAVRLIDEHTYLDELPDNRSFYDSEGPAEEGGSEDISRTRLVPVYEASIDWSPISRENPN